MAKKKAKKMTDQKKRRNAIFDFYELPDEKKTKIMVSMELIKPAGDLFDEKKTKPFPVLIGKILSDRRMSEFREFVEKERTG